MLGCLTGGTKLLGKYSKEADILFWLVIIGMAVVVTVVCVTKILNIFD